MSRILACTNNVSTTYMERPSAHVSCKFPFRKLHSRVYYTYGIILALMLSVMVSGIFISKAIAKESFSDPMYKYYTSIQIQENDTLWSIAEVYMHNSYYSNMNEYIKELKAINELKSDMLIEGHYIIVPYYSDVKK